MMGESIRKVGEGSEIDFAESLLCSLQAPDICWQSSKTIKYLNRHETRFFSSPAPFAIGFVQQEESEIFPIHHKFA